MADPSIKIKRSSVAGKIPTSDQLPLGEIALNTYDGKLYASKNVGIGTTVFAVNTWSAGVGTNTYNTYFTEGNVGVGTTIPTSKFTVFGAIQVQQDSGSNNRLIFRGQPGSSYRWNIDNYSSANEFRIFREDDATAANGFAPFSISPTGTLTATKFSGDGSLLTNLPSGGGGGTNYWNQTTVGINTVSNVGIGTTNSTSRLTVSGSASISGILTADQIHASNNGNGQNVRIGDDAWLGDINLANTIRLSGAQDPAKGFIVFGSSDAVALGRTGTGPLYYGGNFAVSGISTFSGVLNASQGVSAARLNVSGITTISGLKYPTSDGLSGQVLTTDGLGNLTFQDSLIGVSTTTSSTSQTPISTFPAATYSSAIYNIQIIRGSEVHFTTLNLIHDGTTVFLTEYGTIRSGNNLATFDCDVSSGSVRILATPDSSTNTTFKFNRTLITTGGLNTTTTTLATVASTQIDSFAANTYNSAKIEIEVTRGSSIQLSTLNLIHNGIDVYLTEYAILKNDETLATFDSIISGSDVAINATSASATSTTYKIRKTFIT